MKDPILNMYTYINIYKYIYVDFNINFQREWGVFRLNFSDRKGSKKTTLIETEKPWRWFSLKTREQNQQQHQEDRI